ncbi:lipopolysaccharide biosynthesis protein RfbH [candidate division WOR-1 bacterium RIFOXYB2_FULL_48_7]|uniref:Lipopolysaccharide biosynthesis protein RfbH n=1 Tax=candidate division WOR-1 bacterium RIFOXYB2_FULL_48_7 TaxID=1802583 RepID=A0A1F4THZ4_UNCSA|nr:MAG: lipopolysaccharide biosynthesis protein RfbH [candidate division WOR-1 bacterium RIFOXYB2_FULL_48_7]
MTKKEQILQAVREYYQERFAQKKNFVPGDRINYASRVFDEKELVNLVDASLDFWLTAGPYAEQFEKIFAEFVGVKYCSLVNSGSSANLLAFMALTSPKLGNKRINKGDEVITIAAGFPTTIAPVIQYGAIPVFVDVELPSYNIDCSQLAAALSDKTRAVFIAHTLGNPFDIDKVKAFCDKHNLWLIEDNCDSLGSQYHGRYTGSFGHLATSSFYPPHHMTMGEGGAVYTNDLQLKRIVESLRDWGRDCFCQSGKDDTCHNRFTGQFGELPRGYDHKYVYSHFGYNLKATDLQAAIGCAQLAKLPSFIQARRRNWQYIRTALEAWQDSLILPEPQANSEPSWFGFLLTVREGAKISRHELVKHLESKGVQTRMLFAGNMIKHPCFDEMRTQGKGFRQVGGLKTTDLIMNNTFWIGVYPGMTESMLEYMIKSIKEICKNK